jgi:hypothetical protein
VRLPLASLALGALPACHATMVLPSTGLDALAQTPRTVGEGRHAVSAAAAGGGPVVVMGDKARVASFATRYTYGLTTRSELSVAPIMQFFGDGREHVVDFGPADALGFGGDVRYKLRPFETQRFAFDVGAGALTNPRASLATASVGLTVDYPTIDAVSPNLAPRVFLTVHAYGAAPLRARDVVLQDDRVLRATESGGAIACIGVAVPIDDHFTFDLAPFALGFVASRTHHATVLAGAFRAQYTF